jgi:alpha-glucosidase
MPPHTALQIKGEKASPTLCPIPFFFTSENVWHYFDSQCMVVFDFRGHRFHRVDLYDLPGSIVIGQNESPLDCMRSMTHILGRQPVIPPWVYEGACIEVAGGAQQLVKTLQCINESGAVVSSIQMRDWTGITESGGRKRPFYDWSWNREHYPSLDEVVAQLNTKSVRSLCYINPHFSIEGQLFAEASVKGFLVKKPQGGNYICDMGGFMAGILDLTNQSACFWMKDLIRYNILNMGFRGYMADMGQYLPADAVLSSGESAIKARNKWPVLWATIHREAVREAGRTADTVFYTKTGWAGTGAQSMIVSTGDHHASWSQQSGLPSALTASLSLACSGIGLVQTDCGGNINFFSRKSKELYLRWLDFAMFTPILRVVRSAQGTWQFDSDKETLLHFSRATHFHHLLAPYFKQCIRENAHEGAPIIRPMFMQFPGKPEFTSTQTQFMLGSELLVAPVMMPRQKKIKVILPEGHWRCLWTGKAYTGGEHILAAPIGQPPAFFKQDSRNQETFDLITQRFRV